MTNEAIALAPVELAQVIPFRHRHDDDVRRYVAASKSAATIRGYKSDFCRFDEWCKAAGVETLPASPDDVARYVTARAQAGKKVAHVRREVAAISYMHRARGFDPPPTTHVVVKSVLQGIAREHSYAKKQAPAILPADLLAMVETLDLTTNRGARDATVLLTGWTGAFRRSELAALKVEHVEIQERGMLITVTKQKNHQTEAKLKEATLASDPRLCATLAMKRWLRVSGRTSGWLFVSVLHGDHLTDERIAGQTVNRIVQNAAKDAGLEDMGYSAHSLRSGFITHSFQQGKPDVLIAQQTGHQSMNTLAGYHRRATALSDKSPTAGLL
jgi:integrase